MDITVIFDKLSKTTIESHLNEFNWQRRVSIIDIADIDRVLDSSLLVNQFKTLKFLSLKDLPS